MRALLVPFVAVLALSATPAMAQVVKDKKTCIQAVEDAKKKATADAAVVPKTRAEAGDLVRISEHLCTQANFVYAERLLGIVRGMTAGE